MMYEELVVDVYERLGEEGGIQRSEEGHGRGKLGERQEVVRWRIL